MSYNIPAQSILSRLPEGAVPGNAGPWADHVASLIKEETSFPGNTVQLSADDLAAEDWDKFTLSAFAADIASYPKIEDQADYPRLSSVMKDFPAGFSVYFSTLSNGMYVPVGYTGWYPIPASAFDLLDQAPEKITHRGDMRPVKDGEQGYVYLFNYSIAAPLRQTGHSRSLIKNFAASINALEVKGLAAVTVSADGIRVAEKFGMTYTGQMTHMGDIENVYTVRF